MFDAFFAFCGNVVVEVVKSINWGQVLTSCLETVMYLAIPLILELSTGVLGNTAKYLDANKENSWLMHFMSDVATVLDAQWQTEAKDIRAKWDAGELTKEQWDASKKELKDGFKTKMMEKLKKYPAAYAVKFEADLDDHMEAWLAQNKKIEALTKTLQKTAVQSPEIVAALGGTVAPVLKKNISKLKPVKKK